MVQIPLDAYLFEGLMPDLVGHDRRPAAFLVYLHLYRHASRSSNWSVRESHQSVATATGLSRSAVQASLNHLQRRQLISSTRAHPTAVPQHKVLRPWSRLSKG